ncbi:MAG: hypothetical protein QF755_06245 [Candidatus Peribacteraceae bacterium]|jgi:hypothetical protein|nr:hypothetical protein [Candidatus Peribacteraceae bacterium]
MLQYGYDLTKIIMTTFNGTEPEIESNDFDAAEYIDRMAATADSVSIDDIIDEFDNIADAQTPEGTEVTQRMSDNAQLFREEASLLKARRDEVFVPGTYWDNYNSVFFVSKDGTIKRIPYPSSENQSRVSPSGGLRHDFRHSLKKIPGFKAFKAFKTPDGGIDISQNNVALAIGAVFERKDDADKQSEVQW